MTVQEIHNIFKSCTCVTTDSRTLKGGELFFALKGENFDGNEYALKALEAGAAYAVVNADSAVAQTSDDPRLIKVDDTLKTLQELMGFEDMTVGIAYLAVIDIRVREVFRSCHPRA